MEKKSYLTLQKKEEIIKILKSQIENGEKPNCGAIAKMFKVSERTIRRIHNKKENLEIELAKAKDFANYTNRKKLPIFDMRDKKMYDWFKQNVSDGHPISGPILKEKAVQLNRELKGNPKFKGSDGWLSRFKQRHDIRILTVQEEKFTEHFTKNEEFIRKLGKVIKEKNLKLFQIYNITETSLLWRSLPKNSFIGRFENSELSKDRVTIMVCSNVDGSHKIPLYVVGEERNPRCLKNITQKQLPVTYAANHNARMTGELFREWFTQVFLPSIREYQTEREESYNILLILDNVKFHASKEATNLIDSFCIVEFLDSNLFGLSEPINQEVISKIKSEYKKSFLRNMLLVENKQGVINFLKTRDMKSLCFQVAGAWKNVTSVNIVRAWRKILSNATENFINNESTASLEEYLKILHRIPGFKTCTLENVTEWLQKDVQNPDCENVDNNDILHTPECFEEQITIEEEEIKDPKDIQLIDETKILPEAMEAFKCFQTFKSWFENRWECESEHMLQLKSFTELSQDIISHIKTQTSNSKN